MSREASPPIAGKDATIADGGGGGGRRLRLTVVEPLGTGGMIHYAYELCDALTKAGAEVTLLTSTEYELDSLPHSFRVDRRLRLWPHHDASRGETHRRSHAGRLVSRGRRAIRRASRALRLVRAWLVLRRALDGGDADVVQFGTLRFPFEGLFLRLLAGRGLLLADVCHEPELRESSSRVVRTLVARASGAAYRQFDAVFLHGTYNRKLFCRLYPELAERTFEIQIGSHRIFEALARRDAETDLRRRYGLDGRQRAVVYFGHLVPSKGVDVLLRAHALAYPVTGAPLVIAGYPSKLFDVAQLESLVRELGVAESVILDLRYVPPDEVAALMRIAVVVALPYRSASQSGAIQVAYTFGRPVVASRVGGLPEVVDDGKSGLLVEPDSPDELARALKTILGTRGRAEEMGAYARTLSHERFSWDHAARDILEVYGRLAAPRSG